MYDRVEMFIRILFGSLRLESLFMEFQFFMQLSFYKLRKKNKKDIIEYCKYYLLRLFEFIGWYLMSMKYLKVKQFLKVEE